MYSLKGSFGCIREIPFPAALWMMMVRFQAFLKNSDELLLTVTDLCPHSAPTVSYLFARKHMTNKNLRQGTKASARSWAGQD